MKPKPTSFAAKLFLMFALVAAFICAAPNSLLAQRGSTGPTDLRDLSKREQQQSTLERETQRKRDPKQILAEINEDLGRMKVLSEALSTHAAAADQHLNYKSIMESTTEIKTRSVRLKTDLVLPQNEKDRNQAAKKEIANGPLQPALLALNELVDRFLNNPIFSDSGAIDQQLAAKARRDLEDIILLSDKLRKSADKLNKTSSKP